MMKLLVGFIVGVAVATLWFVQFDAEEVAIQRAGGGDVPALTEAPDSVGVRREAAAPPLNPVAELRAPATSIQVESPTIAELQQRQIATFQAYQSAVEAYRDAVAAERWSNAPPPDQPIVLAPEFEYLSQERDEWHELIQREPFDPVWSAATELQIQTYLAERPEITSKYGFPTVNCRTTRCEVAFVAYGIDDEARIASQQGLTPEFLLAQTFRNVNAGVYEQAWAEQFGYVPDRDGSDPRILNVQVNRQNGVATILWHFQLDENQRSALPQ